MIWHLVGIVLAWYALMACFLAVMHAKHIMERERLTVFWKANVLPLGIVGLALDCLFNLTAGTLMFRELPKEWLFTARVQRHVDNAHGWRFKLAAFWRRNLNQADPEHIR